MSDARWRIGELSRRVGLSTQVLRAWETRYGLLEPLRSAGGYRLYSERDEWRVRRVLAYQAQGLSTAEAARLARSASAPVAATAPSTTGGSGGGGPLGDMRSRLLLALVELDEAAAHAALDALFATVDLDTALVEGVLPVMAAIGERWACGETSVAREHYASNIVHSRLLALARGWAEGDGRRVLLACPPGEQHTIGLLAFALMLRRRGWRVSYLGASTPIESLEQWVREQTPDAVVVASVAAARLVAVEAGLRELAAVAPVLLIGGAGASPALAEAVGARALDADPVIAANWLTDGLSD